MLGASQLAMQQNDSTGTRKKDVEECLVAGMSAVGGV
jgi:hypothetical protein